MPHAQDGVKVETSKIRTARWLREQAGRVVLDSSSSDPLPHYLVGIEIEASEMRTAMELREPARRVVPNSSCPDPVPHSRHGVEARASSNNQEMKIAGEGKHISGCSNLKLYEPSATCPVSNWHRI